jgi:hypothetical protein
VERDPSAPDLRIVQAEDSTEIIGHLDRRLAEALALELRAVAKRYGLELQCADARPDEDPDVEAGDDGPGSTQ